MLKQPRACNASPGSYSEPLRLPVMSGFVFPRAKTLHQARQSKIRNTDEALLAP